MYVNDVLTTALYPKHSHVAICGDLPVSCSQRQGLHVGRPAARRATEASSFQAGFLAYQQLPMKLAWAFHACYKTCAAISSHLRPAWSVVQIGVQKV